MKTKIKTEIEKINKGCGKRFEISENRLAICGKYYYDEKEQTLCPSCQKYKQGLIQGAKIMIEDEISFLENLLWENDCYEGARFITQKLSELKQINNWLEKICN